MGMVNKYLADHPLIADFAAIGGIDGFLECSTGLAGQSDLY